MAGPLRIEYPGAFYHVMARGNRGRKIFADDADRRRFLDTLAWWLRRRTTVSLRWVGERLRVGHYTRANRKPAKKLRQRMHLLAELDEKMNKPKCHNYKTDPFMSIVRTDTCMTLA